MKDASESSNRNAGVACLPGDRPSEGAKPCGSAGALSAPRAPSLNVPFADRDLRDVFRGARRVLNEIGIRCDSAEVRRRLAALPGARESGDRIFYGDAAVDAILDEVRAASEADRAKQAPPPRRQPFAIGAPWCCLNIADVAAGKVRPSTMDESARAVRLLEGMGARVGVCPVEPAADVPAQLRNLAGLKTVLTHSQSGSSMTNQPVEGQISLAREMGAAAGREPRAFIMVAISPLRFECTGIEYFLRHRDEPGIRLSLSGSMPCTGSTSPMHLPGTLIQSLAESLALAACSRALGGPVYMGAPRCDPFDMRNGNYVIGSPEYHLLDMASRALYRALHGAPSTGGAFRSMARFPDAQAMAERSFSVLFQALQGARSFGHAGQLSMDELFSPEQAVLDYEILRNVERIVWGLDWREDSRGGLAVDEAVEMIRRGVSAGHYMEAPETVAGFRDFFYTSEMFRYEKLQAWVQRGAKAVLARASEQVEAFVRRTPETALPEDRAREVERIYREAARKFA